MLSCSATHEQPQAYEGPVSVLAPTARYRRRKFFGHASASESDKRIVTASEMLNVLLLYHRPESVVNTITDHQPTNQHNKKKEGWETKRPDKRKKNKEKSETKQKREGYVAKTSRGIYLHGRAVDWLDLMAIRVAVNCSHSGVIGWRS